MAIYGGLVTYCYHFCESFAVFLQRNAIYTFHFLEIDESFVIQMGCGDRIQG